MTSPEFELAMTRTEYDNAIKSLVVASKLAARYQGERDAALAALARVRALTSGWKANYRQRSHTNDDRDDRADALDEAADIIHAALEPTKGDL